MITAGYRRRIGAGWCHDQRSDAEADQQVLRDELGLPDGDSGGGWLIFALPPPQAGGANEFFLRVGEQPWGRLGALLLPDDARLGPRSAEPSDSVAT